MNQDTSMLSTVARPTEAKPSDGADAVDHPSHYTRGRFETIDVIEDWELGFHLGNAVKYISRAGHKDPTKIVEDLKKARWYLDRYIAQLEQDGSAVDSDVAQRPSPTLDEYKANFEQAYGKGAPFDEPPVDPLPPPPVVHGAHALMDFDTSDEEQTRG